MRKRVLVYPCGTEIAFEIFKSVRHSTHYELYGGCDNYDHGRFVFGNLIEGLPFIKDDSSEEDIRDFEKVIEDYHIDFIYPAMDGVISAFAQYREMFSETLIIPVTETAMMCRSKRATYKKLNKIIPIPKTYKSFDEVKKYPIFIKPDRGQGSVGARIIDKREQFEQVDFKSNIAMEYLPGREYTIDCFTNANGKLIYARGRGRNRIKNGISVNAVFDDRPEFYEYAIKINKVIRQMGGWFFQLREAEDGTLKLLEVAARIAGASAISRNIGANLPLMTIDLFNGVEIDDIRLNNYEIELDRALENSFKINLKYSSVYMDYDDTVVKEGVINTSVISFLYQCVNKGIKLILLSRHDGDLEEELKKFRLSDVFDEVIHIKRDKKKSEYIKDCDSIFIDDSYGERRAVKDAIGIPVFDTHMIECLIER